MSIPNYGGNPLPYLSALPGKLEPLAAKEILELLKPDLIIQYSEDRVSFGLVAKLIKDKLGLTRQDLIAWVKPPASTHEEADEERFSEEDHELPEYTGDVMAFLSALPTALDEKQSQEVLTILRPDLADLYSQNRALYALAANLVKEKLGVGHRDLEAGIKPLCESEQKISQATRLVELAEKVTLFHTPDDEAWATFPVGEHEEHWAIRSKGFRRWLAREFYQEEKKAPGSQAVQDSLGVLEGKALYEGEKQHVFVRSAEYNGKLYLDLANESWQAVEVSSTAWRVVDCPPVRFRRSKAMLPLPTPRTGGKIDDLWPFVNVCEEDRMLLVAWLLMSFAPCGPYPVLGLGGGHGSAKSTTARVLRSLVDPSTSPLRTAPREERDLMISANAGRILAFDNLSRLPTWISDAFCRLATGGGFSTRELYSNDDETIFDAQRPVLFTSIADIAVEGDLIDRGIRLILPQMTEAKRKAEALFWAEFDKAHPSILGALLDVLVTILRRRSLVTLKKLPRMADFALWIAAACPALGWEVDDFLTAYENNRFTANRNTLDASTVAKVVLLLAQAGDWEGTAGELLDKLWTLITEQEAKERTWPKTPLALANALRRLVPSLQTAGVTIEFSKSGGKDSRRTIRIGTQKSDASDANEEEPAEEPEFAQDYRDDLGTLHNGPATPSDAGASQDASLGVAPPFGASPKKSNEINAGVAGDAGVAEKRPYSKPVTHTEEVF